MYRMIMKIIQMMGPIHLKGGGWAQETAPEAVRLQVKTSGTALATPRQQEQLLKVIFMGCRGGSAVRGARCPFRGLEFGY